ncbi:MAG: amidohydrolase family protein [Candidatus Goldbacteria bacterium]|nr:amidohydrolase family protein [Candidatus Goldiibacteriota bacterium]
MLTITNARIFNGLKFIKANTVEIHKNIIKKVYYSKNFKNGLNINSSILCPGFIDIHTHSSDIDILDIKSQEDIIKFKNSFLKKGVTSFLLTMFYKKNNKKLIRIADQIQNSKIGSRCIGIYFESPFINKEKKGAIPIEYIDINTDINEIKNEYKNIKIITIAPEINNSKKIFKLLKKNKIIPSFGHSNADYNLALYSLKYGIKNVTHLFNAMSKWNENKPPTYFAFLKNKNIFVELIADGIHIPPTILKLIYKKFGKNRIILISDKVNHKKIINKNKKINSKLYLLDMICYMKKICNLSIKDILQMVTYNPAKLLKLKKIGMIQKGFIADMLILNKNLHIEKVIFNGKIVF